MEDEKIIKFIALRGNEQIRESTALLFARHPDKQWASQFLIERLKCASGSRANYMQGLETLGAIDAVPVLETLHDELRRQMASTEDSLSLVRESLRCCPSLSRLAHLEPYKSEIQASRSISTLAPADLPHFFWMEE